MREGRELASAGTSAWPLPWGGLTEPSHPAEVFRARTLESANRGFGARIPKPYGPQQVVYGDKVINLKNGFRYDVWPKTDKQPYLANGDIGILVGQFKTAKMKGAPWKVEVEFATQPGRKFGFSQK